MYWFATSAAHPNLTEDDLHAAAGLRAAGHDVSVLVWDTQPANLRSGDTVVVRSCWDYHLAPARFVAWLADLAERGVTVANGYASLQWNMHKGYLLELSREHGIPIPPTILIERGQRIELGHVLDRLETHEVVVKPAISLSSHNTRRMRRGDDEAAAVFDAQIAHEDVLVQPFLPAINQGELSLVFFGGAYSHAVLKRPASGDFRVQKEFGGMHSLARPHLSVISQAARVLSATGERLDFARVDGIVVDGTLLLMELELIDPVLFFSLGGEQSVQRFVRAVTRQKSPLSAPVDNPA